MGVTNDVDKPAAQFGPRKMNGLEPASFNVVPPTYAFAAVPTPAFAMVSALPLAKATLVMAPPGYGKTVLLAELFRQCEQDGLSCCWVGIDGHIGPQASLPDALLWHLSEEYVDVPEALDYRQAPSTRDQINTILGKIRAFAKPLYIFIDNADLGMHAENGELLDRLIFSAPPYCHLVISCSTEPPFDMTGAMLEGRLTVIGPKELGFGPDQINALFKDAGVTNLTEDKTDLILTQSEGWPAAVRLMQVLATTAADPAAVEPIGREGERLTNSLFDKLVDRLPEDLQTFLFEASVFNSFSEELLVHATCCNLTHDFLDYLINNKILILSVDQSGEWFRFHTLFRRYLSRRATEAVLPPRRVEVMRRGAQWLERKGNIEASLELSLQVGDRAITTRLMEKLSVSLVRGRGFLPAFIGWAERVKQLGAALGTDASFWLAWALIFARRYEEASDAIAELKTKIAQGTFSDEHKRSSMAKASLAQIVLKLHMDDLKSVQDLAPVWLEQYSGADTFENGAAAGAMALALLADHEFNAASSAARISVSVVAPTTSVYGRAWAFNISAAIAIASGAADEVEKALFELETQIRSETGADDTLIAAVTAGVRARALYERGDVAGAVVLANQSLPLVRLCGMLDFVYITAEVLLVSSVIESEGVTTYDELRQIATGYPGRLGKLFDLKLIQLYCDKGRVQEGRDLAERLGIWSSSGSFNLPADFCLESERSAAVRASISLMTALGDLKGAEDAIRRELETARQKNRRGFTVELHLAQAAVHIKAGQQRYAGRAFSRAMNLAAECKAIRPFYEQKALVAHLKAVTPSKELGLATEAARQIAGQIGTIVDAGLTSIPIDRLDGTLEPLTKREMELLRMLDAGMDNAQISELSGISVRTVKWHLHNLYAKMDVKNRTSAIARGRQLQLL